MKHLLLLGIAFAAFHVSHSNTPDFCRIPYDEGKGEDFKFSVYYDAQDDQCYPFIFNGQGGNANRFENEKECIRNCSLKAEDVYPMNVTKACHLKKAAGGDRCKNRLLRFYYDSVNDKCVKFYWTGCNGNGNRFPSSDRCYFVCTGVHDDGDDPEEEEPDTPVAIILGVLLALVLVGVIIAAIVLTIRSKKKKAKNAGGKRRDPSSGSPLHEGIEMS